MPKAYMLTTVDNPYNPFTQFKEWYMFDMDRGYNTCGMLAKLANIPDVSLPDDDIQIIVDAIDQKLDCDPLNLYIKVSEDED